VKLGNLDVRWSNPAPEQRALEQVSDIGIAFAKKVAQATAEPDTSIPAVYRGFQFLTDIVAGLPLEEIEAGRPVTPAAPIVETPNPHETYHDTMSQVMSSLLFRGNAYLWPRTREMGDPTSLIVLNPDEVSCTWDTDRLYPVYSWRDKPMEPGRDIIPIPLNRWPGRPDGVSPISACRLMLDGAKAEQTLTTNLMLDDATPAGALNIPDKLTVPEAQAILDVWEETHQGRKRPGVLGGGATWQALTFSPVDAQFLESRNFSVQEIGRMLGLHGLFLLVASGDSLTYSTTESLFRLTLTSTVAPTYLDRIEQAWSRLLPRGRTARFNTAELLRADLTSRYQAAAVAMDAGFITADEVRLAEGLPPLGAGESVPRELAEIVQKIYMGVGSVLTIEEARLILKDAGATLGHRPPQMNGQSVGVNQ
jgi:HK97 family phage portal protein